MDCDYAKGKCFTCSRDVLRGYRYCLKHFEESLERTWKENIKIAESALEKARTCGNQLKLLNALKGRV